jgi:hypothetical protein
VLKPQLPLFLGLLFVAVVALIWVPPAIAGPTVDCGQLDQATYARVVPEVVAEANAHGWPVPMPVTSVSLSGSEACLSYQVKWLFGFGYTVAVLC